MEKYLVGHQSELYEMLPIVLDHLRKKKFEDHFDLSSFFTIYVPHFISHLKKPYTFWKSDHILNLGWKSFPEYV